MKTLIYYSLICFFLSACSLQKAVPLSADLKKQVTMLPDDALVIGYVNVHQIMNSPVYELLYNEAAVDPFSNKSYEEFIEKTGFDLRQNMHEMLFAGALTTDDNSQGMFVALGNFDIKKITDYIKTEDRDKELVETKYNTFILLNFADNFTMCFADSSHFVAGARQLVQNWLDEFSGVTDPGEIDSHVLQRIETLPVRESMWMVMDAGTLIQTVEREGIGLAKGFKNIQHADIAFSMDESLEAYSRIACSDAEKAGLVYDAIRGFLSTAKLTVSEDRDAVDVLNKIDTDVDNDIVTSQVKLDQKEIKKLLQKRNILHQIETI